MKSNRVQGLRFKDRKQDSIIKVKGSKSLITKLQIWVHGPHILNLKRRTLDFQSRFQSQSGFSSRFAANILNQIFPRSS